MKPQTILHTEASDGWGGQEIRILLEMEGLQARGHRMLLAAPGDSRIAAEARTRRIPTITLPLHRRRWPASCGALRTLMRAERVSIVNTHSSADSWAGAAAAYLCRPRPLLVRTRHLSTPISNLVTSRLLYDWLPDGVITTGEAIKDTMVGAHGFREEKIRSIPTGVDLVRFDPDRVDTGLRKELGVAADRPVIGTVGVLRSWKGHLILVEAARRVVSARPDTVFLIVGEGPGRDGIERRIKALNLEDHVRLIGHRSDVERAFAALDLVALASTGNEGVPQALLQALAMGKPVIASDVGCIGEIIRPGETGRLIPPRDHEALADGILRHLTDPVEGVAMARAGRRLIQQRYSVTHMLDQVEAFYEWLGQRRRRS